MLRLKFLKNKARLKLSRHFYTTHHIGAAATKYYDDINSSMTFSFFQRQSEGDSSYIIVELFPRKGKLDKKMVYGYCNLVLKTKLDEVKGDKK
ncbi:hypothetical protein ACFL0W_00270 [Nanoarchaeota archaeon]